MESFKTELEAERERRWYFIKRASFLLPFVSVLAFGLIFHDNIDFPSQIALKLPFSLSTCAVAFVLAGTYYYAYKFFTENFYFFIFISWVTNAVYLLPDLNGPVSKVGEPGYLPYKIWVFLLSFVSSLFLLPALLSLGPDRPANLKRSILLVTAVGLVGVGIGYAGASSQDDATLRLLAMIKLPGAFLTFVLLCLIGIVLRSRVSNEAAGAKEGILLYTYYLYGALQFIGPFTPSMELMGWGQFWVPFIFLVAQLAKVGNAIAMTGVLQAAITDRDLKRARQAEEAQQEVALKNAELEAQQTALRLKEANVEKRKQFVELGMLASSIKHDVNTPLATMGFDIEVLKNRYQHDKAMNRKLENLERSMERIHAIVQVVDIFRGDQGFYDREQYMTKVSMLEIVRRAVRSIKNEKKSLKQENAKDKILVEGKDVWVRAYVPLFEQVIVNVIKNGLESIEEAGRDRGIVRIHVNSVDVKEEAYPRWAKVEIEDNGIGIPDENMKKLTTIFTTRGDKKVNSGIGLFIGKKIVDIHSGRIEFESTVGKGTKVTLLLPEWNALQRAERQRAGGRPEANGAAPGAAAGNDAGAEPVALREPEWVEEETYE